VSSKSPRLAWGFAVLQAAAMSVKIQANASKISFVLYKLRTWPFPQEVKHPRILDARSSKKQTTANARPRSIYHGESPTTSDIVYAKNPVITREKRHAMISSVKPIPEKKPATCSLILLSLLLFYYYYYYSQRPVRIHSTTVCVLRIYMIVYMK
jgi:hypothetical protein